MDPVEYQIIDTENPENNRVVPSTVTPLTEDEAREKAREEAAARIRAKAVAEYVEVLLRRRTAENKRALRGRVAKRRKAERLAKASRKRNRG